MVQSMEFLSSSTRESLYVSICMRLGVQFELIQKRVYLPKQDLVI